MGRPNKAQLGRILGSGLAWKAEPRQSGNIHAVQAHIYRIKRVRVC
jgi:hypothetical protein